MEGPIRVLVVDDSSFVRNLIVEILSADEAIKVIGEAADGREGVEKNALLKPDIITMDIEMPVMGGLEAIEKIMVSRAVPILVVTSKSDAKTAYDAVAKGALEVLPKPQLDPHCTADFVHKVKLLAKVKVIRHIAGHSSIEKAAEPDEFYTLEEKIAQNRVSSCVTGRNGSPARRKIVAVASSTGGPKALALFLSSLPADFPAPVVVAQHVHEDFSRALVNWLDPLIPMKVRLAQADDSLEAGIVYIAPAGRHMQVKAGHRIGFKEKTSTDICSPSCDLLLSSAARVFAADAVGVILTGMGEDGAVGMLDIKQSGGATIAQDENTSLIYGMPKAAIENGCVDRILPLGKIADEVMSLVGCVKQVE